MKYLQQHALTCSVSFLFASVIRLSKNTPDGNSSEWSHSHQELQRSETRFSTLWNIDLAKRLILWEDCLLLFLFHRIFSCSCESHVYMCFKRQQLHCRRVFFFHLQTSFIFLSEGKNIKKYCKITFSSLLVCSFHSSTSNTLVCLTHRKERAAPSRKVKLCHNWAVCFSSLGDEN